MQTMELIAEYPPSAESPLDLDALDVLGVGVAIAPEDYLAAERLALTKHEYDDGEVIQMPGASKTHNHIASNINFALQFTLRKNNAEYGLMQSDLRVHNPLTNSYHYPDIVLVKQDDMRFADSEQDVLLNPIVIIEILSSSTEEYDRGRKFESYKRIASLQEYVLVSQTEAHVECYTRTHPEATNEWLYTDLHGTEAALHLRSVAATLQLSDIYAKVSFLQSK
jgi:Uma2 family endonuclease